MVTDSDDEEAWYAIETAGLRGEFRRKSETIRRVARDI